MPLKGFKRAFKGFGEPQTGDKTKKTKNLPRKNQESTKKKLRIYKKQIKTKKNQESTKKKPRIY